jgi:RNA polymerase subunit RPABC4/transcription elongation factor Spt4
MDIFTKIGNKVSSVASSASTKVKDIADTTSINRQIAADEGRMNTLFSEIGKIYYNKNKNNPTEEFQAAFNEIAALEEKIANEKAQLQALKKTKTCTNCGGEIPMGAAFCANCGTKAPEDPVAPAPAAPQTKACTNCGTEMPASAVFCPNCGTKAPEDPVAPAPAVQETKTCPNCGKVESATVTFCSNCGCKVN